MPNRTLITGGMVFDSLTGELSQQDILVDGERIEAVQPGITADGVERFDATGKWITPGFIDMHVHVGVIGMESLPAFVGNGVTTVRDLGGDSARLRQMALDVASGKVVGPNIIYAGPLLQQVPAYTFAADRRGDRPGAVPFTSPPQATEAVRRMIDEEGVGSLKIYTSVQPPIAKAIIEGAAGRVPVTGHLGNTPSATALEYGINGLEHLQPTTILSIAPPHWQEQLRAGPNNETPPGNKVAQAWSEVDLKGPEVESFLRLFLDRGAHLTATVTVTAPRPPSNDPRLTPLPLSLASAQEADIAAAAGGGGGRPGGALGTPEQIQRARENQRGMMQLLYQHGGDMLIGTDVQPGRLPGFGYHGELAAFQGRGIKAPDVLRAATALAAKHLWRDDLGVIAPGRRADLVILDQDPTQDITTAATNISHVMQSGRLHESAKLLAIAEEDGTKFFPAEPPNPERMYRL